MPTSNKEGGILRKTKQNFNKEVHTLRLSLTTKCTLNCRYCFVEKDGRVISFDSAKKILRLFLSSHGKDKMLIIYGGEPLLFLGLLKKIVIFSKKIAKENNKKLIVSTGTNGTLLNKQNLAFLRKEDVKISISIDGKKEIHNKARVTSDQKGSFALVIKKIPLLLANTEKQNICVLFGVLPTSVAKLFENFLYIIKLGFDSVNIEPIQSPLFKWTDKQQAYFKLEMKKVIGFVYASIESNDFVFLNSVNRELNDNGMSKLYGKTLCPFYQNLEVYPDGELAFSPFLINSPQKKDYIIGNANSNFLKRYEVCQYNCQSTKCQECLDDYRGTRNAKRSIADDVVKVRNAYSIYLARKIRENANNQASFPRYMSQAKKRIFE
jgi:sulfatase maturation enzyme AslB (radical SAM superfamily)